MGDKWSVVFQNLLDDAIYKIGNELERNETLLRTIEKVAASLRAEIPARAKGSITRLYFLHDLYDICQKDIDLFRFIAKNRHISTTAELAIEFYDCEQHDGAPNVDSDLLNRYKTELSSRESTAVLLNLVKDLNFGQKTSVVSILEKAVKDGFNASRTSLSVLFMNKGYASLVPPHNLKSVREVIEALQRLFPLVVDAPSLLGLLRAKLTSARAIAATRQDDFAMALQPAGVSKEVSNAIYQQAIKVERRNERIWVDLIRKRKDIPILAVDAPSDTPTSNEPSTQPDVNMTSLFDEMDSIECDQYNSVLSPAAYLVDLLQLLRSSYQNPKDQAKGTMYDVLLERRPDLPSISLTKDNSIGLVRYADLAVEIMEAHIASAHATGSPAIIDNTFGSINWDIYEKDIRSLVSPMKDFPYNHAHSTFKSYLDVMKIPLHEFVDLALSNTALQNALAGKVQNSSSLLGSSSLFTQDIRQKFRAASVLNLQFEDFVAISGEGFQSLHSLKQNQPGSKGWTVSEYNKFIRRLSVGEYWGYKDDDPVTAAEPNVNTADHKMVGKVTGVDSLKFVRDQLLVRSNLKHSELLEVLDTIFIGRRLVISLKDSKGAYSDRLSDMRLHNSPLALQTERLDSPLLVSSCSRLSVFIRLWRKSGWNMQELDAAIDTLLTSRASRVGRAPSHVLDPEILVELSAIKELHDLTSINIMQLLVLWGDITTYSKASSYSQLFVREALKSRYPGLTLTESQFQTKATFADHWGPVLSAFVLTEHELTDLLDIAEVKLNDIWSVSAVSKLFRITTVCDIFNISINNYPRLSALLGQDLFLIPSVMLNVIQRWQKAKPADLSADGMVELLSPKGSIEGFDPVALNILSSLLEELEKIQHNTHTLLKEYDPTEEVTVYTATQTLSSLCGIFDAETANLILKAIEGSALTLKAHEYGKPNFAKDLPTKLQVGEANIQLRGILTSAELDTVSRIIKKEPEDSANIWLNLIGSVQMEASGPLNLTLTHLDIDDAEKTLDYFYAPASDKNTDAEACKRYKSFLTQWSPYFVAHLSRQKLQDVLVNALPQLDVHILDILLCKINVNSSEKTNITAKEFLVNLLGSVGESEESSAAAYDGYLLPSSTGEFNLTYAGISPQTILVDGKDIQFATVTAGQSSSIACRQGIPIKINVSSRAGLAKLFLSSKSAPPSPLSKANLCEEIKVKALIAIARQLKVADNLCATFSLGKDELALCQEQGVNLVAPQLADLELISSIKANLKLVEQSGDSRNGLLRLYEWKATGSSKQQLNDLTQIIEQALKVEASRIVKHLTSQFPNQIPVEIHSLLIAPGGIERFKNSVDLSVNVQASAETMTSWAVSLVMTNSASSFEAAQTFRSICHAQSGGHNFETAHENLVKVRSQILSSYVLTRDDLRAKGVKHADNLFEYFLIDTQMGPQLQSSRIREAISSVQLFVQRSLLGLEKRYGISTYSIDQSKWSWMSRYSLWQANRQVFLYPENYLEPSLRGDKSEVFKLAETAIMQGNLNKSSITTIMKDYILAANDVADLDVQTYLWESSAGFKGTYHIFARTRTAPYRFYHRRMVTTGGSSDYATYNWHAWTKLDVDVTPYEVDSNGATLDNSGSYLIPSIYRGRLFLFTPQIMLKTDPKPLPKDVQLGYKLEASAPTKSWEIKIGWTEYRNGKWSKKETSQASLVVAAASTETIQKYSDFIKSTLPTSTDPENPTMVNVPKDVTDLPSISSFRFWVRSRAASVFVQQDFPLKSLGDSADNDVLVIDVLRWVAPYPVVGQKPLQNLLGSFELRGTQVVSATSEFMKPDEWVEAIPTEFCKLYLKNKTKSTGELQKVLKTYNEYSLRDPLTKTKTDAARMKPQNLLMTLPPVDKELETAVEHRLTWTLSFNESQFDGTSALVVERRTKSKVQAYFGVPIRVASGKVNFKRGDMVGGLFTSQVMKHDMSQALMESVSTVKDISSIITLLEKVPRNFHEGIFGWNGSWAASKYRELSVPYSIYNWELGFHLAWLLMERLLGTQQFELALDVARLVFDPSCNDKPSSMIKEKKNSVVADSSDTEEKDDNGNIIKPLSNLDKCWRFPPFKSSNLRLGGSAKKVIDNLVASKDAKSGAHVSPEIEAWIDAPFDPHAIACHRPAVYMKRFVTKYVEILLASGDEYFRQNSMDTIAIALQRYVEAGQLLGPAPQIISRPTKSVVRSFADIIDDLTTFSTATVDMELVFPYYSSVADRLLVDPKQKYYQGVLGMARSQYFPVPPNPQVAALRDLIDDRFFKIRNNLDINGNPRRLPLFDPPADPAKIIGGLRAGGSLGGLLASSDGPMPNYRFLYLLQKAFELCAEVKAMGDAYLAIKEKKDGEALTLLRSKQELTVQSLYMDIKEMQKKEAECSLRVLEKTRDSHVMRLKFYLSLIGESIASIPGPTGDWIDLTQTVEPMRKDDELRMSSYEREEMQKYDDAANLNQNASALESTCAILGALPKVNSSAEPFGVGVQIQMDASIVATGLTFAASVIKAQAADKTDQASRASRKAQLTRQLQERKLQANTAGRDIKNTDEQIAAQKSRIDVCNTEIRLQRQQTEHLAQIDEFYRSKYTGLSLYTWMDSAYRKFYYDTYLLAMDVAKSAEKAFAFERGPKTPSFLSGEYWDNGRDGSMAANGLHLTLKRMEAAYHSSRAHDFEITKNISLRQIDPYALLKLQQAGKTEFSLPEVIFDQDFPGHYCRRIKSVSISIMCVVGPYTGPNCTLKLMEQRYRMRAKSNASPEYYPERQDADDRFHTDLVPISSIAVSSGTSDSGVFNLDFQGERYGPFEGAGVISRWELDFPSPLRQFDYSSIADVVMNLRYTALDGGPLWRTVASDAVLKYYKTIAADKTTGGSYSLFDLRNDFSSQWMRFASPAPLASGAANTTVPRILTMTNFRDRLPYYTTMAKQLQIFRVWLAVLPSPGSVNNPAINSKDITFMGVPMNAAQSIEGLNVFTLDVDKNQKSEAWKDLSLSLSGKIPKIERSWLFFQYIVHL